jgi:hypothetical protein
LVRKVSEAPTLRYSSARTTRNKDEWASAVYRSTRPRDRPAAPYSAAASLRTRAVRAPRIRRPEAPDPSAVYYNPLKEEDCRFPKFPQRTEPSPVFAALAADSVPSGRLGEILSRPQLQRLASDGSWRAGCYTFHMQHGEQPAGLIRRRPPHHREPERLVEPQRGFILLVDIDRQRVRTNKTLRVRHQELAAPCPWWSGSTNSASIVSLVKPRKPIGASVADASTHQSTASLASSSATRGGELQRRYPRENDAWRERSAPTTRAVARGLRPARVARACP